MKKVLNSFHLKLITVITMIVGMILITWFNYLTQGMEDSSTLSAGLSTLYIASASIYLVSFPLAGFLLVEGALHTSDKKKFILRLLIASLIAELLIDFANYGLLFERYWWNGFNFFYTMLIALIAIFVIEGKVKKFGQGTLKYNVYSIIVFLLAAVAAVLLRADQGATGVMTIIAIYMFMGNPPIMLIAVAALQLLFMGNMGVIAFAPVIGIFFTFMYNKEQGTHNKVTRWIFYLAYPIAFVIVNAVIRLI